MDRVIVVKSSSNNSYNLKRTYKTRTNCHSVQGLLDVTRLVAEASGGQGKDKNHQKPAQHFDGSIFFEYPKV